MRPLLLLASLLACADPPEQAEDAEPNPDLGSRPVDALVELPTRDARSGCDAPERCEGTDEDCDGRIDEGLQRPCGEAAGLCEPGVERCEAGAWIACDATLAAEERCEGRADEDCDNSVDEGCPCAAETLRECGSDEGRCALGEQRCVAETWSACEGATGPAAETCEGTDEDCDGRVDEALERPCGSEVGACTPGRQICAAGEWSACGGGTLARAEVCEGSDDDCDGRVDERLEESCGSDVGRCRSGSRRCVDGAWGACGGGVQPGFEDCEGGDQDCDGAVDEGCACRAGAERACGSGLGDCERGRQRCQGGMWGPCEGGVVPGAEACDGAGDEDCDGRVDEGCACVDGAEEPCGLAVGLCRAGARTCANGAFGPCVGGVQPVEEACDGGRDEDCDGAMDEGCECADGATRICGDCDDGEQICAAGRWGLCEGGRAAGEELCEGAEDEDCDGRVDEGCDCVNGGERACGVAEGRCREGVERCARGAWGPCLGSVEPAEERCEGRVDEDCDGSVDEGHRALIQQTTYGALAVEHPSCDGAEQRFGANCLSAMHRLCRDGCRRSGFGPVEHAGDNASVACVTADVVQTSFAVLAGHHPGCTAATPFGKDCFAAADFECRQRGAVGGYGPVEFTAPNAQIACLSGPQLGRFALGWGELAAHQPACDGGAQIFGTECASAIHRACRARGFLSGVGPVQNNAQIAGVVCVAP